MATLDSPDFHKQLSSVWCRSCDSPIHNILISQRGVVAVATENNVYLYAGTPNFGVSHTLSLSPAKLTAYSFSADGTYFLTGDSNGFLKWWDVHIGEETSATQFPLNKLDEDDETNTPPPISCITCSQESELVAVAAGNTLCIYGHGGLHLFRIGPFEANIKSIEWNTTNELAVNIGTAICMIKVTPEEYMLGHQYPADLKEGSLSSLSCSPNGTMIAAGCSSGVVRIWDLASEQNGEISGYVKGFPKTSSSATEATPVQCLAWDSTGHYLAAAGDSDVVVWDMQDAIEEEGRDNSIVCFGYEQNVKITSIKFQPNGRLLATGGDDCRVLVFDSQNFTSTDVVRGLVGCTVSGKVAQDQPGLSSITSLAWDPNGLILAGTNSGYIDAFEISGRLQETTKVKPTNLNKITPFIITNKNQSKRINSQRPAGWGGEPLITTRNDDHPSDKFSRKSKTNSNGNPHVGQQSRPARGNGGRPNVPFGGRFKPSRPPYNDHNSGAGGGGNGSGNWHPSVMIPPTMVPWHGAYPPQQMPPYIPQHPGSMAPFAPPNIPTNPPQTPESNSSEGNSRNSGGGQQAMNPQIHSGGRNERPSNRNGTMNHHHQQQQQHPTEHMNLPGPHGYPMGYIPFPPGYPMGYPPQPYSYYPMGPGTMPPHTMHETVHTSGSGGAVPVTMSPVHAQSGHGKSPQGMHVNVGGGTVQQKPSGHGESPQEGNPGATGTVGDLEEELGSKSSEATNNGVNNGMTPLSPVDSTTTDADGRSSQAQTLYIGNLAQGVEESLLMHNFSPYGPIVSIQVIRDRDTHLSRGFAFVTYAHPIYAQSAMQHMDSVQIHGPFEGKRLKVSFSNRR